jgi:hypothetical protein
MRESYKKAWDNPHKRKKWSKQISDRLKLEWASGERKYTPRFVRGEFNHSDETKRRMSERMKGKYSGQNNPRAISVVDDNGKVFGTIKECARYHNIHTETVKRRINKGLYSLK